MSEKHQSSDLTDLPKWDRSNQGVYAAVGRICEKLHDRARKIGEGSGPPNLTGIKALRTPQIYETKIGKHLLQTYRDATTSDYHAITFYGDKLTVRVGVDETRISAILQDLEADGLGGLYEINKPVVVGQVAANALNVMRGEIAKAELNVAKKMIDVVNS